jgi:hypothetical protein
MHATVRRYEGIDQARADELTEKVGVSLMPRLSKLPGFGGYYLIKSPDDVFSSIGVFETPTQAEESNRVAASWLREQNLETALPHPPQVTCGEVVAHQASGNGQI